jgi:hypothetical protein
MTQQLRAWFDMVRGMRVTLGEPLDDDDEDADDEE